MFTLKISHQKRRFLRGVKKKNFIRRNKDRFANKHLLIRKYAIFFDEKAKLQIKVLLLLIPVEFRIMTFKLL
jgi:hypothetical protein